MAHPFLDYTLEGFRCFSAKAEFREPRHVNVICGPNNSGKSTLLLPLRRITTAAHPLEIPYHGKSYLGGDRVSDLRFRAEDVSHGGQLLRIVFHRAIDGDAVLQGAIRRTGSLSLDFGHPEVTAKQDADQQTQLSRQWMCEAIFKYEGSIMYVPAVRRVQPFLHKEEVKSAGESVFDGSLVLPKILEYANPPREGAVPQIGVDTRLNAIESKMSMLLGQKVEIRPLPVARDIELTIGERDVALSRCGTGIEQLLIFSVALVEYPDSLLLIEEPENFLHPTLQRRVMEQLLRRAGDSVMTTHSNHLLDIRGEEIAYYRTFLQSGASASAAVERIDTGRKYNMIWDLGVRPSSLFESNASIWVEGPSDALYLRKWLSFLPSAKGLIEGIDYTFAFHAGALLDKFFANPEGGEPVRDSKHIVNFFDLHPNFFIVADSDGDAAKEIHHAYLQRLVDQLDLVEVVWVTHGKEIENYLPTWVLERWVTMKARPSKQVVKQVANEDARWVPFWRTINQIAAENLRTDYPNKVEFAQWACSQLDSPPEGAAVLGTFDLRSRLERLVSFIRKASGKKPSPPLSPDV
jgi:ABC-type molybdenum transport system ATPase subunit/photorepair protein PhrA